MDSLLEETIKDSPVFRESLNTFDEDVDELIKWFETLQRSFKQFSDELFKANELSSSAIQKLLGGPLNITMESNNVREIRVMADSLQSTYSLRAKLVDDLIESVTTPLLTFINKDIKEIKDSRRVLDRIMERYDSTIFSFSKLSKSKEQSALKEDAFQLYEARKIYIKNTLDITIKVALFKQNAEIFMSEVITSCLIAHSEFFNKANDVFNGIKPTVESLKSKLDNSKTKIIATEKMANLRKKQLEEEYISRSKPTSTADALSTTVTIGMSKSVSQYQFSPLKDKDTQGKEGYLFKRSQQNGLLPSWSRKYVYFKDAGFSWSITTRKGGKTTLSTSEPINFLLCQIRMWTKEDRRFTFEIYTHKKSFVLQAENEDDLNSWISTFNAIKTKCAAKGSIFTEGEINGGEDEIENDDDEDDVPGAPKVAETVCDNRYPFYNIVHKLL